MRFALAIVFGALPCQAFRPWTRPAWEGVAIVKQGISVEPSPACLEEMGRKHAVGGVFEGLKLGVACVIVCSSHKADPLLEGALAAPAFAGNDKEVFEFLQGLSNTDKQTLWRSARWYNYLVELTLPEDEE